MEALEGSTAKEHVERARGMLGVSPGDAQIISRSVQVTLRVVPCGCCGATPEAEPHELQGALDECRECKPVVGPTAVLEGRRACSPALPLAGRLRCCSHCWDAGRRTLRLWGNADAATALLPVGPACAAGTGNAIVLPLTTLQWGHPAG